MTEVEAVDHVRANVPRETLEALEEVVRLVRAEAGRQNLISPATLDYIWSRHIVDSLQLLPLAGTGTSSWLDIGSGAGFPGLVVAAATPQTVTLVEPRRLRADFLRRTAAAIGLDRVIVHQAKVEAIAAPTFEVISARAVASLERLFEAAVHLATVRTLWLLPKGRTATVELEAARRSWQGEFRLVPSITDPAASIVVARGVQRRMAR